MKIFTCTDFEGHNPIGTSAVIIAENETQARELLSAKLKEHSLTLSGDETFQEVDSSAANAIVLGDGDY